jgi:CheY-like chemotaxis protein
MSKLVDPVEILMADDDADDRLMAEKALKEYRLHNGIRFVVDGEDLMDYLYHRGKYADPDTSPEPGLILLDLNMPRKDGREALAEIKADPKLRHIPVVVLTTSKAEEDIIRSYDLGVNSYITKPVSFQGLAEALRIVSLYWFEIVRLPNGPGVRRGTADPAGGNRAGN